MPTSKRFLFLVVTFTAIFIGCQQTDTMIENQSNTQTDTVSMKEISGQFDVNITPTESDDPKMGLMLLDKTYRGALDAVGKGRMLTGMTDVQGSAGYVAIEKVSGSLEGANGSFLIQHSGFQQGESKTLIIQVIPDSGTAELTGIEGTMEIDITDSGHQYRFRYSLPSQKEH